MHQYILVPLPPVIPTVPSIDFKGKLVLLDAGHGGHDPGAVRLGVREKDITLAMVLDLKKVLEARGAKVVLTRKDDKVDLELADIAKIVKSVHPDVFLSIHVNSAGNDQAMNGVQTYFRESGSRCLAHTMHSVLICDLPVNDRGVYTSHYYVLNNPAVPSLLIETGYITNRPERRNLMTPSYRHKFCLAIANGLSRYWAKPESKGVSPASSGKSKVAS
jgi:N-acetylmuramoyl-L-alanine amidase